MNVNIFICVLIWIYIRMQRYSQNAQSHALDLGGEWAYVQGSLISGEQSIDS